MKGSKRKFVVMTGLFALVSLVILLYPREVTVNGIGKTVSAANYSVAAGVSGKVIEIRAAEGSEVQAGSIVMKLSNDKLAREIEEIEKTLEINKAIIDNLVQKDKQQHKELIKSKNSLTPGTVTSPAVEEEQKKLQIISKDTAIACKEKEKLTSKLKYLQSFKKMEDIKAPIDGVILSPINGQAGRYLSEGEDAFSVGSKGLIVECFIPESKSQYVSVGSQVILRPYASSDRIHHGIIIGMDLRPGDAVTRNNAIRVTVGVMDAIGLTRGMKYQARIHTRQRTSLVKDIVRHLSI